MNGKRVHRAWSKIELFSLTCRASRKSGPVEAVKRSIFTLAVLQKYLTDESKIYIFITKVPRVVY